MKMFKLRKIVSSESRTVYGIGVPDEIVSIFENTFFEFQISGNNIILKSGCQIFPTKKEIDEFNLESIKAR
jgi:hypothetical protein